MNPYFLLDYSISCNTTTIYESYSSAVTFKSNIASYFIMPRFHLKIIGAFLITILVITVQFAINIPVGIFASQWTNFTEVIDPRLLTYENPDLGIKLQYPFLWSLLDFQGKVEGYRDIILVPLPGNSTALSAYMNIANLSRSFNNLNNITLDQFTILRIDSLEQSVPNFNLTKSTNTTLGGQPAHTIEYVYPNPFVDDEIIRGLEVWTLHKGHVYNFNYIATVTEYSKNLETVTKIVNSLEFI